MHEEQERHPPRIACPVRLEGSTALVTGGSRGIGKAIAQELIGRGVSVALVARSAAELEQTAERLGAVPIQADLSDPASVDQVVSAANDTLGRIDLLVNNAALVRPTGVPQMTDAGLVSEMQANLLSPMRLVHRLLPGMLDRGRGHIVNVSSGAAALPLARMTNYCASKAGLLHYSASLRSEIAHRSVGVTVVELGTVAGTQAYEAALEDETLRRLYSKLKRVGLMADTAAEEIAERLSRAVERNKPYVRVPRLAGVGWALNSVVRDSAYYLFRTKA